MPGKYRRRRRYGRKAALTVRRPLVPIGALAPESTIVSLNTTTYETGLDLGLNFFVIDLNNPNKPFLDTSNQPRGYDQWAALYNRAMVVGYHLRVSAFCNRVAAAGSALVPDAFVMQITANEISPDLDWLRMAELPDTMLRILPCNACDIATASASGSVARKFGLKELDEGDFSVEIQTMVPSIAPIRKLRCMIASERFDSSLAAGSSYVCVTLIQRIRFFGAKDPPPDIP